MGYISNGIVFNLLKNGDLAIYYNIDIENIMLSEIIYTEKEKYCMISLICENQKKKKKEDEKKKLTGTENKLVVARDEGVRCKMGNGVKRQKLSAKSHGDVIYSMATLANDSVLHI